MSCKIIALPLFSNALKKLAKKYPSIKQDFKALLETLSENPQAGVRIKGMDIPLYKIRMATSDKHRGKSGGFRVIYFFKGKYLFPSCPDPSPP
ncbi:MAG TPA: hypothetical protein PLV45_10705 [bacterium]|nr:hypothetical protein [bacterium]